MKLEEVKICRTLMCISYNKIFKQEILMESFASKCYFDANKI